MVIVLNLMKRVFFLFLFVVAVAISVCRAENIRIHGKVSDEQNKPVEFATVRIEGSAIGTNTDLKGDYSLTLAPRDTLDVIVSCLGFKNVKRRFLNPKGDITLNVKLYTDEQLLSEVEVIGTRNKVNGMQDIDTESLKLSPDVSGGSVESLLATQAGVNSSNEMSSQYSVRGGSFDENSVIINGTEIYRPQLLRSGQQEGLSIVNPDMVGSLRFSTGGFPARYSDKMSSVLDITYREPEAIEGAVSLSLMGGSLSFGQNSGKFSQLHGLRLKKNNSLLSGLEEKGEYDPLFFDYQTNLIWKPTSRLKLSFLGNISLNHFNFKPSDRVTSFGTSENVKQFKVYFDGEERDRFQTYLGAFTADYRFNAAHTLQLGLSGFITDEFVSYDISGEYWLNQAGTGGEGAIGGELGVGKYMEHSRNRLKASVIQGFLKGNSRVRANNFSYGITYRRGVFHDRTKEWEWRDSAGYSLPTSPDAVHLIYNLSSHQDISTNRLALYIEDSFYWDSETLSTTLNVGARASYWDFNKEFLFSPRVNLTLVPRKNPYWNFRVAAGLYYQSPFYKEYRQAVQDDMGNGIVILNRDIKSPRSIQFIFGTDYTFRALNRPFKLTGEAYYKNLANLVSYEYDNLKVVYSGVNDANGYALGLDFKLFGQFVEGSDSWISFSLMKTQQTLNGVKVPLPTDQRYALGLYFTDYFPKFPKLKFSLRGILSDGLTMVAPRIDRDVAWFRAPSYRRIDIGLSYQFIGSPGEPKRSGFWGNFKSIVLGVDCFNLLDITNVSSYYWVTDVNGLQYAVPNYLTRRQINVRLAFEF